MILYWQTGSVKKEQSDETGEINSDVMSLSV